MLYYHVMTRCALYRTNWCCFVSTKRCRAKKIMGHQVLLRGRWRALVPAEWCILILYCQRVLLYCIKVWSEFREERETHFKGRHLNIKWNCFFFFFYLNVSLTLPLHIYLNLQRERFVYNTLFLSKQPNF